MESTDLMVVGGGVALATVLLPIRQWQNLLLWGLGLMLRLVGLASVAASCGIYLTWAGHPSAMPEMLAGLQPVEWLALAPLVVAGLFPVVSFLDFIRRLDRGNRQVESLSSSLKDTSGLLQEWLEQAHGPGAVLSPARRAELTEALSHLNGTAQPSTPSTVRTTLAALLHKS